MTARSLWYIATPWRCLATAPLDRFGRDKLLHRRFPNFLDRALPSLWHRSRGTSHAQTPSGEQYAIDCCMIAEFVTTKEYLMKNIAIASRL